jgi:Fe-S cluster assembly iron-binding protein IscA
MKQVFSIALFVFGGSALLGAILDIPRVFAARELAPDLMFSRVLLEEAGTIAVGVACLVLGWRLTGRRLSLPTVGAANRRDIVTLTPEAARLFHAIIQQRSFPPDTALRVALSDDRSPRIDVQYDIVSADDQDWVGECSGVTILVAKGVADGLEGLTIDAQGGQYTFRGVNDGAGPVD